MSLRGSASCAETSSRLLGAGCYVWRDSRKPGMRLARVLPYSIALTPLRWRSLRPGGVFDIPQRHTATSLNLMRADPSIDPNAELRTFEPLRVVLAVGSLLLAVLMSLH
ncbi:hypothetical protein GCM10010981_10700 [Dyella nitratireducens]|uniref:Uncharacterized protein n=1 Tax=Dyella nitratireducens TaxID=1849580 RepID=A0ABQ1FNP8_9GAMM|nr:hypothetical protein GCM10010981_10700 [Dyella nitratireducens]GLQ43867.1 hypothetical protein GCM10007902_37170 [Dyella nitratireducens]